MTTLKYRRHLLTQAVLFSSIIFGAAPAFAGTSYFVTNGNDSGDGSLRDALLSGATVIKIGAGVDTIQTESGLVYNGSDSLKVIGSGQTIDSSSHQDDILTVSAGADTVIRNLTFDGGGNYSIFNQGGGKGIFVDVPETRTGDVVLKLVKVTVKGVGDHGIHVSDCDAVPCGAGGGGGGDGSPASIKATLKNVIIDDVGFGNFDADGLRIDDRGDGGIDFKAKNSVFINVGADGVELDEGNDGDVSINVLNSFFKFNGAYCAPIDLSDFPETEEEVEPEDAPPFEPTADDRCVEWDETEYVLDLDDGFDIDEAGDGSILGKVRHSHLSYNDDEGLDLDEEDDGGFDIRLVQLDAIDNGDEGIKISEEDGGDINANLVAVTAIGNSDDGIQIEEEDEGDVTARVVRSDAFDNNKDGIDISEDGSGSGTLKVRNSNIDIIDADNVDEI